MRNLFKEYMKRNSEEPVNGLVYYQWEESVTMHVEYMQNVTRSDAQGIIEAADNLVYKYWQERLAPDEAAKKILNKK